MDLIEILVMALSLSVDSLVVSMSGSVTVGRINFSKVMSVALVFGIVQAVLLFLGWLLGASVVSLVHRVAHIIGFVILLYIGGSMAWSALRGDDGDKVDLGGMSRLLVAAVATSIDALAVGVSLAMSDVSLSDMSVLTAAVGLVTMLASGSGIACGSFLGRRFGRPARVVGGLALIAIGVKLVMGSVC